MSIQRVKKVERLAHCKLTVVEVWSSNAHILLHSLEDGVTCCQSSPYLFNVTLRPLGLWLED